MKLILAVFALACLVAGDAIDDGFPDPSWVSMVESSTGGKLLRVNDETNSTCDRVFSCLDCSTARICRPNNDGGYELLKTVSCTGDRPFCDPGSGSCVSEEPESCGAKDNFVCLGNGKYPDTDCKKFHACLELQSMTLQCPVEGSTYNAITQICEASAPCGNFDCAGNEGRKIPHSNYLGYYAYCQNNNGPLVIDSCPRGYELNTTSQICEPPCNHEGIVADVSECHYYFKCTKIYVTRDLTYMKKDRLRCPEGQAYSTRDFLCVQEANVESCSP